jgi:hypothetical protein
MFQNFIFGTQHTPVEKYKFLCAHTEHYFLNVYQSKQCLKQKFSIKLKYAFCAQYICLKIVRFFMWLNNRWWLHQKLCIFFVTCCKVYVDTDLYIYNPNCALLVMNCRIPINITCILADCQNGTYTCGHMRNIYPFCIQCHVTQCDLLCAGIDNSSLHYLLQGTLKLCCNEKGTYCPM